MDVQDTVIYVMVITGFFGYLGFLVPESWKLWVAFYLVLVFVAVSFSVASYLVN